MNQTRLPLMPAVLILLSCFCSLGIPFDASAHPNPEGKYRCVKIEVRHHAAPCQSPPLILGGDGSYQIWGERGTYEVVKGEWLLLSHSKRRGMGHFQNLHDIIFEVRIDGQLCRVTFQQILAPPRGVWSS